MSPKERRSKRTKKKKPTKAMLQELKELLERHKWTGTIISLHDADSIGELAAATGVVAHATPELAPTPDSLNCTPPAKPTFDCDTLANGTIVCGWVCR